MNQDTPFSQSLDQRVLDAYPPLRKFLRSLGDSPLIEIPSSPGAARIFAKCEWTNPFGTVKDRAVFGMLYEALRHSPPGDLHLLEYTGGSLGLSLSQLCAQLEINLTLTLSESSDPILLDVLRGHGTHVVLTPKDEGFWGVMQAAQALAADHPSWTFLYQHANPANVWIHRETTGPEFLQQLPPDIVDGPCAWIASIGTGATLEGVRQCASKRIPHLQTYATTPTELPYASWAPPNGLPKFAGSGGLGSGRKQPLIGPVEHHINGHFHLAYRECLQAMIEMHALLGWKIGSSAAANWLAALRIAQELGSEATVFTLFPSAATGTEWQKATALFPSASQNITTHQLAFHQIP